MKKVKSIMTKMPITLDPENSVLDASRAMNENNCRHLIIMKDDKLCGILSDRNVLSALSKNTQDKIKVHMSWPVYTVFPETDIQEAIEILVSQKVSCLVVEDHVGKIVGIITTQDLLNSFRQDLNEFEEPTKRLTLY